MALNPADRRAVLPASISVGRFRTPATSINGTATYEGTPQQATPFKAAPRLGFAWDVTGDSRTAIRGGAGAFYDRNLTTTFSSCSSCRRSSDLHDQLHHHCGCSPACLLRRPTAVRRIQDLAHAAGRLQLEPGGSSAMWVGIWWSTSPMSAMRHAGQPLLVRSNGQSVRYRLPAVQPRSDEREQRGERSRYRRSPTPVQGYAAITSREFTGYSDYHSVQLSATRRRPADGLSFGAAYTYEFVNKALGAIDPFLSADVNQTPNYNSIGRRPHTLTINYSSQRA